MPDNEEPIKVIFTGEGGTEQDKAKAIHFLWVNKEYEVEDAKIGKWRSEIKVVGVDGYFNTSLFDLDFDLIRERFYKPIKITDFH